MFTKALNWLKGIFTAFQVAAPALAAFGVVIPPVAIAAAPVLIAMMSAAEDAMGDGTGALKKAAVTQGVTAFAAAMKANSTGGQAETWAKITPDVISATIDGVAAVANSIAQASGAGPVFDDSQFNAMKAGQSQ